MAKRIVALLFALIIVAFAALLIVPNFIDWNKHKDKVVSVISNYTDAYIEVDGEVYFKVLPTPELMLGSVKIGDGIINAREIGARVKLIPLLEGKIEVDSLKLVEPVITFNVNKTGKTNWSHISSIDNSKKGAGLSAIKLNNVTIQDGVVAYTNEQNKSKFNLKDINLDINANTIFGPYNISGHATNRGTEFAVDIKTKKYKKKSPVSFTASFLPNNARKKYMPEIKLSGVLDITGAFGMQSELTLQNGRLYDLIGEKRLNNITFLKENVKLRSLIEVSSKRISFNGISLTANKKKTSLKGKGELTFYHTKLPALSLELEGENITLTNRGFSQYIYTPKLFDGHVRFKGKNVVIAGKNIGYVNTSVVFNEDKWKISPSAFYMTGKTKIDLSGEIDPNLNTANYKVKANTEDFSKFVDTLSISKENILRTLADNKSIKSLMFDGNVSLSPNKISLYNMKTNIDNFALIEGVINIDKQQGYPNFEAKVNLPRVNISKLNKELARAIMNSRADIELTANKVDMGNVILKNISFSGITGENHLDIKELKAEIGRDRIVITGLMDSIYPTSYVDLKYNSRSGNIKDVANLFGVKNPPLLFTKIGKKGISGHIKGNKEKYFFDFSNATNDSGLKVKGTKVKDTYNASIKILTKNTSSILEEINLPIDKIINNKGALQFAGDLVGTNSSYKINNIKASIGNRKISGSMSKAAKEHVADIKVEDIDIDKVLFARFKLDDSFILNISGSNSWGGKLSAKLSNNNIKGKITDVDLMHIAKKLDLTNLNLKKGDLNFNLQSATKRGKHLTGDVTIRTPRATINEFNYSKLGKIINDLDNVPTDLRLIVRRALNSGSINLEDVVLNLNIDSKGNVNVEKTEFNHPAGKLVIISGTGNLRNNSYQLKTEVSINQPKAIPAFAISKDSSVHGYNFDLKTITAFIKKNNPPPVLIQPNVAAIPAANAALPPQTEEPVADENNPISDILDRLEE